MPQDKCGNGRKQTRMECALFRKKGDGESEVPVQGSARRIARFFVREAKGLAPLFIPETRVSVTERLQIETFQVNAIAGQEIQFDHPGDHQDARGGQEEEPAQQHGYIQRGERRQQQEQKQGNARAAEEKAQVFGHLYYSKDMSEVRMECLQG